MNNNYISMCREAKELQDDWEPKNHDACWWKSWNEFKYEIPSVDYVNLNSSVEFDEWKSAYWRLLSIDPYGKQKVMILYQS